MYIAVSNADRIIGLKRLGISPTRIVTIYNATQFSSRNSRPLIAGLRIIMVARNDHQKDYETFFRALARVCFESADVVGRGTDHCSFVAWARGLAGLNASKIRFLGCRPDVEILLENANLMILSSRFEGLPISIIEAMSKSLPVLASNVGGVPELVESGLNGFLFESGDVDHLVGLISFMNEQPKMRYSMGEESRSRFERNFTLQTMLENTMVQYALALSSSRAPCSTTCVFPNLLRRDG
jgi:glycosyltransferase involved in cell wall biosynthesis